MLRSAFSVLTLLTLGACGPADLGEGSQGSELVGNVGAAVESCRAFDGYTAALGALAVDCLGTIGPDSFYVDKNGHLRRNFDRCSVARDKNVLPDIDDLLGIQILQKEQPGGVECIAGRWQAWQKSFLASGIKVCPVWTKTGTINGPTPRLIDAYAKRLPELPANTGGLEPPVIKAN